MFQLQDKLKTSWMQSRSRHWNPIENVIVRHDDLQDVKITQALCGTKCWNGHHLIKSYLHMRVLPPFCKQRPQRRLNVHKCSPFWRAASRSVCCKSTWTSSLNPLIAGRMHWLSLRSGACLLPWSLLLPKLLLESCRAVTRTGSMTTWWRSMLFFARTPHMTHTLYVAVTEETYRHICWSVYNELLQTTHCCVLWWGYKRRWHSLSIFHVGCIACMGTVQLWLNPTSSLEGIPVLKKWQVIFINDVQGTMSVRHMY